MQLAIAQRALLFLIFGLSSAFAAEPFVDQLRITVETTAASSYLWRGWETNSSASLQPAITLAWRDFSLTTWHNFSRHAPANQAWTEHDLSFSYTPSYKKWKFTLGATAFLFPDKCAAEGNRSYEFTVGVTRKHWLQPSFAISHDFKLGNGTYYYASTGHTFQLTKRVDLSALLGAGLNQHQWTRTTTLSDVDAIVSSGIVLNPHTTLTPSFTYMTGNRTLFGSHRAVSLKLSMRLWGSE